MASPARSIQPSGPALSTPAQNYRPTKKALHNLVYGVGLQACPGRRLATMELVVAVQALMQATPGVEHAPDAAPERETYPLGGWHRVPVRLRAG